MLVLTLGPNDEIVIGDPCHPTGSIKVVYLSSGRVKLGITMPLGVAVNRKVVADRIVAQAARGGAAT